MIGIVTDDFRPQWQPRVDDSKVRGMFHLIDASGPGEESDVALIIANGKTCFKPIGCVVWSREKNEFLVV